MEALMDLDDDGLGDEGEVLFGGDGDTDGTGDFVEDETADIELPGLTDAAPVVPVTDTPITTDENPTPAARGGLATKTAATGDFSSEDDSPNSTKIEDGLLEGATGLDAANLEPHIALESDTVDLDDEDANVEFWRRR